MRYLASIVFLLATVAHADTRTNGRLGINAVGLKLPDGSPLNGGGVDQGPGQGMGIGVGIGMVEDFRPGDPDVDTDQDDHHDAVNPFRVFNKTQPVLTPPGGGPIANHGVAVASVMIGNGQIDADLIGVSPAALLSASAATPIQDFDDFIAPIHRIATLTAPTTKAINHSYGVGNAAYVPDGNDPVTQYVDWSAARHDILHVIANNQIPEFGETDIPLLAANFNGITVVSSGQKTAGSFYDFVDGFNTWGEGIDAEGDRVSADIMAPGFPFDAAGLNNQTIEFGGSSGATAHVTGAVALLHQYWNYRSFRDWNAETSLRHEVIKAVLLNSADKFNGIHGSSRTIFRGDSQSTWADSPANSDISIPLDEEMGAGHLNVKSAFNQYRSGEWEPGVVPNIGWDYGSIGSPGSHNIYYFNRPLAAGEVVAATLCWDRRVETISPNSNNHLDGFFAYQDLSQVLNDLDMYLMRAGTDPTNPGVEDIIWASVSAVDNVEHIFFPVPTAGVYQLVVLNTNFGLGDAENYGLAWWAGQAIPGDFNVDGNVDGNDLSSWKTGFGTSEADSDDDGDSDGADFLAWQRNLGFNVPPAMAVPEPTTWLLGCLGISLLWRRRVSA